MALRLCGKIERDDYQKLLCEYVRFANIIWYSKQKRNRNGLDISRNITESLVLRRVSEGKLLNRNEQGENK